MRADGFPGDAFRCDVASDRLFTGLAVEAQRDLAHIQSSMQFPEGHLLFREGEPSEGILMVASGTVRLSICSHKGQQLVLRIAGPGEILGLSATVSGKSHEATAETTAATELFFIKRKDFLRYLKEHTDACMHVVEFLSNDVHQAYHRVRALGLARMRQTHL
jgi:CRP/FNR family transcriptional regulator, cyclic AMP receptor protein